MHHICIEVGAVYVLPFMHFYLAIELWVDDIIEAMNEEFTWQSSCSE